MKEPGEVLGKFAHLRRLFDKPTKIFFAAAFVALCGINMLGTMMHGNLQGIVYPFWRRAIAFGLFGQMLLVLPWYLWTIEKQRHQAESKQ